MHFLPFKKRLLALVLVSLLVSGFLFLGSSNSMTLAATRVTARTAMQGVNWSVYGYNAQHTHYNP